jgi:hypothetical protein
MSFFQIELLIVFLGAKVTPTAVRSRLLKVWHLRRLPIGRDPPACRDRRRPDRASPQGATP